MRTPAAPRVSVVIPVFNGEAHLVEAVESALAQTLAGVEVIVVDDGSVDGTAEILAGFESQDERVRVLSNERNTGLAAATNQACQAARAPYVARLDADDVALPDRLARQVKFLDAHPHVAAVGGAAVTIDRFGKRVDLLTFPTSDRAIKAQMPRRNCLVHSAVTLRRAALEAVGGYRFSPGGGYDLWLRLSERYELANLPEPVVLYRLQTKPISPDAVEEVARNELALLMAAGSRAAHGFDPLDGISELGPDVLERIGVPRRVFERRFGERCLRIASELALLGRDDEARVMLETASRSLGPRAASSFRAEQELRAASMLLRRRAVLAAGRRVARAVRRDPRYAGSRIRATLADRWPSPTGRPRHLRVTPGHLARLGEIPGMVSAEAGVTLYRLALVSGPEGDVVEIGSWLGRSTAFLAQACEDSDNGVVHAVDWFRGNPGRTSGALAVGRDIEGSFRANIGRVGLAHRVVVHAKRSEDARPEIPGPLRMLFIDGEHTYEAVTTDLEYAELLAPGGILVVDDYSNERPGVVNAVREHLGRGGFSTPSRTCGMLVARRSS